MATNNVRPPTFEDLPDVLTARLIASFMDIGYVKALNLVRFGGIPHKQIGKVYRVTKRQFGDWLYGTGKTTTI